MVTVVRSREVLPWSVRRRLHPPGFVSTVRVPSAGSRATLMSECRAALREGGFDRLTVLGRPDVTGDDAQRRLDADEQRAEREDYWWSGTVCWSADDGSRIVYVDDGDGLRFVGWGPRADDMLAALGGLGAV